MNREKFSEFEKKKIDEELIKFTKNLKGLNIANPVNKGVSN